MLNKLNLYIDTITRIPLKQNFFLVKEKVLKKILPVKISTLDEIEGDFYSKKFSINFIKNSNKLIDKKSTKPFWESGILDTDFTHYYHSYVAKTLKTFKDTNKIEVLNGLWEKEHDDIEFIYNLKRMYKFKEIMDALEFNDNQKISVINSWIFKNPPQKDSSWMGFNCSIRLINWVKILVSLKDINSVEEKESETIFLSILQNLEFISKNIEHHIPGNHVIFQYFSVWLISFLIEDKRADKYSALFENEFRAEFLKSGFHFELSTHYHLQVLQLGVYYSLINSDRKKSLINEINKAYIILDLFSFSKNNLPLIGDNCYNFFHNNIVEDAQNLNYLKNYFNFTEDKKSEIFEIENQYIVVNKNKIKLIFDVGNIGMKENPGHGHSDILSLNYSYDGIPIFIDPGTKRYSNLSENLELKRVCSHNTISVNNEDQSKLWGFFRWAFLPNDTKYNYKQNNNSVILEASFDGYKNIGGAKHSRKIEINNSDITIFDRVEHNNLKVIEQNFILSEFTTLKNISGKHYLEIDGSKFEFIINSDEQYKLEVIPQNIYKSYDNPIDSNKIRIIYSTSSNKIETTIKIKLINE